VAAFSYGAVVSINTAVNGIFLIDRAAHLNGLPNTDIFLKKKEHVKIWNKD
jgi:hypothetical protein